MRVHAVPQDGLLSGEYVCVCWAIDVCCGWIGCHGWPTQRIDFVWLRVARGRWNQGRKLAPDVSRARAARSLAAGCCDITIYCKGINEEDTRGHARRRPTTTLPVARRVTRILLHVMRPDLPVTCQDSPARSALRRIWAPVSPHDPLYEAECSSAAPGASASQNQRSV